ncbi:hypothetical protein GQ457_02G042980 [Hibiscus cannabinus]
MQGIQWIDNRAFEGIRVVNDLDIVVIMEPRVSGLDVDNFIRRSGFDFSYRVETTCFSGGIWHLECCLCNAKWYEVFATVEVFHLPRLSLDHRPIMLTTDQRGRHQGARPYRFVAAWNDHPDFERHLSDNWKEGAPIFYNLLYFHGKSKMWNVEVSGHIGKRKAHLLARIRGVELAFQHHHHPYLVELEEALKKDLNVVLEQEESL